MTLTKALKEALWLEGIARELNVQAKAITVLCDSQSAIQLSKQQVYHERTKYIDFKLHFVREVIARGSVLVEKISIDHNPSDMITKSLPSSKFFHCVNFIQLKGE